MAVILASGALQSMRLAPFVLAQGARVYVRGLPVIVPVAIAVFGTTDVALHALNDWLGHPVEIVDVGSVALGVAVVVVVLASAVFGEVLFAGMLDRVVEADLAGRRLPSIGALLSGLPYLRLVLADGLVVGLGVFGIVLCVLPGLAAFTLLGLAGPLVIVEGLGPWRAVRRSFQLLRGRLGAAVLLVLAPSLVVSSIDDWITGIGEHWSVAALVAAEVALDATLAAYAGLLLAVLARRLTSAPGSAGDPG